MMEEIGVQVAIRRNYSEMREDVYVQTVNSSMNAENRQIQIIGEEIVTKGVAANQIMDITIQRKEIYRYIR